MANYTITAANVIASTAASIGVLLAGESVTPGMPLYLKAADNRLWKANANAGLAEATVAGIALNVSAAGQPLCYCVSDPEFEHGTNAGGSVALCLSVTAGALCPLADLASGGVYANVLGATYGETTDTAVLNCGGLFSPEPYP